MNTLESITYAIEQLRHLSSQITLAVLHPDFHGQHRLFAPILTDSKTRAVFIAVPDAHSSFATFVAHLDEALQTQLDIPSPTLPTEPVAGAAALAKLLNRRGHVTLILDAYDLLLPEDGTLFVATLANYLTKGCRIVLAPRELPMALLEREDLQGKIALVPVNPDKMLLDYAQSANSKVLEVRTLGPGRVLINGRLVNHWDGVLPRTLFFYFVDRGMTTRDEIFQTFWPTLSIREATNVFHVTKRKISEILGTDLTVYWSGFYRVAPDLELHYDAVKFAEAVQNAAVVDDEEAMGLLLNAIELYNGPFLSTMDQEWIARRRGELSMTYAEALAGLARIYKSHGDKHNALGCFLRAAATNPQREDLARAIMELYRDLDRPTAALETYELLVAELKKMLSVSPAPQTTDLANAIRASL